MLRTTGDALERSAKLWDLPSASSMLTLKASEISSRVGSSFISGIMEVFGVFDGVGEGIG